MKYPWFRTWRWIYLPISWQGILVTLIALAFSIQVFFAVDTRSHSVSDTLYGIFPYIVPCWMLAYWVATKTASSSN